MLLFSFICSILFCVVLLTFAINLIVVLFTQKKLKSQSENQIEDIINGFKTLDLNREGGADDKEKE